MSNIADASEWHPVVQTERCHALDALRGLALLGVLLVNLLGDFRVSLAEHILTFHTHPGWANRVVDVLVAGIMEFKAFALFSFLFGVGIAVFAERAAARHVGATRSLARRFAILLAMGLCHLFAIWNGDILTLYAVCGFLLLPILRLPVAGLAAAGAASVALTVIIPWEVVLPTNETLRDLATDAARVYSKGGIGDVLVFHWRETRLLVMPLLVASLPRTWGLMALGAAACVPG